MSARLTTHEIATVVRELRREAVRAEHPQHLRLLALRGAEAVESLVRQVADLTQAAEIEERASEASLVLGGRRVTEETIRASAKVKEDIEKDVAAAKHRTLRERHREWVIETMMRAGNSREDAASLYAARAAQGRYAGLVHLEQAAAPTKSAPTTQVSPARESEPSGHRLTPDERAMLTALVEARGESAVLTMLEVGRSTLSRAMAGLPLQRSTLFAICNRIKISSGSNGPQVGFQEKLAALVDEGTALEERSIRAVRAGFEKHEQALNVEQSRERIAARYYETHVSTPAYETHVSTPALGSSAPDAPRDLLRSISNPRVLAHVRICARFQREGAFTLEPEDENARVLGVAGRVTYADDGSFVIAEAVERAKREGAER